MGAKPATAEKNGVILIRMGVGREEFALPEGTTLADLLRMAQARLEGHAIFIDGKPLEESLILNPGTIVSVVPQAKNTDKGNRWLETVGMFPDDADFNAMVEAGRAYREADRQATIKELESEEK